MMDAQNIKINQKYIANVKLENGITTKMVIKIIELANFKDPFPICSKILVCDENCPYGAIIVLNISELIELL